MNDQEHFPDDWIEPGEFRFCAAGTHLLPLIFPGDGPHHCECCEGKALWFEVEAAMRRARIAIAQARKDEGRPRLFWMQR